MGRVRWGAGWQLRIRPPHLRPKVRTDWWTRKAIGSPGVGIWSPSLSAGVQAQRAQAASAQAVRIPSSARPGGDLTAFFGAPEEQRLPQGVHPQRSQHSHSGPSLANTRW